MREKRQGVWSVRRKVSNKDESNYMHVPDNGTCMHTVPAQDPCAVPLLCTLQCPSIRVRIPLGLCTLSRIPCLRTHPRSRSRSS